MTKIEAVVGAIFLAFSIAQLPAAEDSGLEADMKKAVQNIQTKLKEGKATEAELEPELKEFDALLINHKEATGDQASQILLMKAMLYLQVFHDTAKGEAILQQIKTKYPESKFAGQVDGIITQLKEQGKSTELNANLKVGNVFPPFEVTDLEGKPLSVAGLKAKVVLIDFWATWCGPCVNELPSVSAAYEKHHSAGFEIIGISLDKDKAALTSFLEKNKMAWPQYFDGLGWKNKLAVEFGIQSIPATFLLNGEGKIIGRDLRGEALEAAVAQALK